MAVHSPNGTGGFIIEASDENPASKSAVVLNAHSTRGSMLTPAGVNAIEAAYASYLTAPKSAAIAQATPGGYHPRTSIGSTGFTLWVLPADLSTMLGTLFAVLQAAVNVELH